MATRKGELTVQGTELQTSIEPQSRKITKGREQKIVPVPSAFALVIEQLEIVFDEDLRLAIFERLVREQQQIAQQVTEEEKLTKAVEIARLEAIEQAREKGKKSARAEIAQRKREKLAAIQKQFIEVDLEKLIDSCDYLPYEMMKQTIDGFAAQVGVKLEWKELEDGQFECNASVA
ncbi:hypothetical protein COO91_08038 [Nostoc flagelliforme CCNUN1]|uniref:Uncharacterized protein n=1 Tax=Nostoc flagelliforme CCNUN1 TaxID=2038116 RepID=A0A2K8T2M3_9NOSO|nr:hypothetical protein [Nostoc flagelliforme]AUB41947.1 hypothetical protein COO91_08038 [Nostoc flagelliforme CCNUN1]